MRRVYLIYLAVLFLTIPAPAQGTGCGQSWMPKDAPAFCSWRTEGSLPDPRTYHSVVTSETSIYVLGGFRFDSSTNQVFYYDSVLRSAIGDDCTVGQWTLGDYHIKGGRSSPQALSVDNTIVIIGGWGDLDLIDVYDDVQVSAARADGTPAPWRTTPGHLTTGIYGHATSIVDSGKHPEYKLLLSVGGQPGTGAYANWISFAYLRPSSSVADGIGIWRIAPTGKLPAGLAGLGAASSGGRLYVIGGNDGSGQYHSDVLSAQFDFGQP